MPKADIAIITVIREEYQAVLTALERYGCRPTHDPGTAAQPNQYGWVAGELKVDSGRVYQLVIALAGLPGPTRMADAVSTTVRRYTPRHVLLVGIAGGFPLDGLSRGDVALSSVIYDYEYGKITTEFAPRLDFTYQVDSTLLNSAIALHARDQRWTTVKEPPRPSGARENPKLIPGAIASGNKVVDNADNAFFARVRDAWPKLLAVEMEGAGAASAIESVRSRSTIGFMMVRGISDMPQFGKQAGETARPADGNKAERDLWKRYAATTAAEFTIHWIVRGWPLPPARTRRAPTSPKPDGDVPPPAVPGSHLSDSNPAVAEAQAGTSETSVWLGFDPEVAGPQTVASGRQPERTEIPVADLKRRFVRASVDLLRWPTTVAGDKWLERPELDLLSKRITSEHHSVTVVLGPPGSGKSAFLARLGQQLVARRVAVLAIKADQLRSSVDSGAGLAERLDLPVPADRAVPACSSDFPPSSLARSASCCWPTFLTCSRTSSVGGVTKPFRGGVRSAGRRPSGNSSASVTCGTPTTCARPRR
jgi:nucleoside phosphorylase